MCCIPEAAILHPVSVCRIVRGISASSARRAGASCGVYRSSSRCGSEPSLPLAVLCAVGLFCSNVLQSYLSSVHGRKQLSPSVLSCALREHRLDSATVFDDREWAGKLCPCGSAFHTHPAIRWKQEERDGRQGDEVALEA